MTKHLTREKIDEAMRRIGQSVQEGRARTNLDIQGKSGGDAGQKGRVQLTLEDHREDRWRSENSGITRVHARQRQCLFTPIGADVSKLPKSARHFGNVRITRGTFLGGESFRIQDFWRASHKPNRRLGGAWVRETHFIDMQRRATQERGVSPGRTPGERSKGTPF